MPSAPPVTPAVPAKVVTTPALVILRIVPFPASATNTLPAASTTRPSGAPNNAAAPVPSAEPLIPGVPANVVTTPAGVAFRIVRLAVSAM